MKKKKNIKEFSTDRNVTIKIFLFVLFCFLVLSIIFTITIPETKYEVFKTYYIIFLTTSIFLLTIIIILLFYLLFQCHKINFLISDEGFKWTSIKCQFTHLKINDCYNEKFSQERNQQFKFNKLLSLWLVAELLFYLISFYTFNYLIIFRPMSIFKINSEIINFIFNSINTIVTLIVGAIVGIRISNSINNEKDKKNTFNDLKAKLCKFNAFIENNYQDLNDSNYLMINFLPNFCYNLDYKKNNIVEECLLNLKKYLKNTHLISEFLTIKYIYGLINDQKFNAKRKYWNALKEKLKALILLIFEDENAEYLNAKLNLEETNLEYKNYLEEINLKYQAFLQEANKIRSKWKFNTMLIILKANELDLKSELNLKNNKQFNSNYLDLHYFQLMYLEYIFQVF